MIYLIQHVPESRVEKRPGFVMMPKYLTIHSTANLKSTAQNERDYLTNPANTAQTSFHVVVDEKQAIECIPLNETAWHAGDGRGEGNMRSIGLEICESGDREKTLDNAVEVAVKILMQQGLSVDRLRQHYNWSGKNCPRILRDSGRWDEFVKKVSDNMEVEEIIYNYMDNSMPEWARGTIQKLIDKKFLKGNEKGELGLNDTMLRVLVINDRAGLYGD